MDSQSESEEKEGAVIFNGMNDWSAMRTYPNKKMVAEGFYESHLEMRRMAEQQKLSRGNQAAAVGWTALAPMNFAGRVISLGFDPVDPNTMWAGSASGGLWKTTTGGTGAVGGINWTNVPIAPGVLGIGAIAVNPLRGNTLYVGTGEVYDNGSGGAGGANVTSAGYIRTFRGSYGVGIFKSTDGGANWKQTLPFSYSGLTGVADIVIDPVDTNYVYAATSDGIYRTINAGSSWTRISSVAMASDLCFKPGDNTVMYAGFGNMGSTGYGIYKSTNVNAASPTFSKLSGGLPTTLISGKILLSISANDPLRVYASIGKAPGSTDVFALYSSLDEGVTWTQKCTAATAFAGSALNQGWYAHDVVASPTNASQVYWAEMELFFSSDGGSTFGAHKTIWSNWDVNQTTVGTTTEGTVNTYAHADIHHVYISPFSATTLFLVTDGGIFKSTNSGTSWIGINGGLMTVQIYANMGMSGSTDFMIGGMQDNEGIIYAGSTGCKRVPNLGDGFHSAINPLDDNICYTSSYYFNLRKSINKGVNWSNMGTANSGIPPAENACFNSPLIISPSTPTTLYGGTIYVKKTTNSGTNWANVNGGVVLSGASNPIISMAVSKTNANLVYASTAPGGGIRNKLWKSTDGGASFTNITGTLPDRYYSDIAVDPTNDSRIAVTLSGFGSSHIFLSNDAGLTWTNIGINLVDVPANTAMFDPVDQGILYVGNDIGVFAANRLPLTGTPSYTTTRWLTYSTGFPDGVMVSDLLVKPGATQVIRMATYGRGLWENSLLTNAAFSVLPVTMTSFTGENHGNVNQLKWTTNSESSAKRYEVEYSTDGSHFIKVGQAAAKNGAPENTYTFDHAVNTYATSTYYRIKTVDIDGEFTYSTVVEIKQSQNTEKIYLYPNPASEAFKLHLPANANGVFNLVIIDQAGRVVKTDKINVNAGGELNQDIRFLPAGNYHVTLEGKSVRWNGSLIKQK